MTISAIAPMPEIAPRSAAVVGRWQWLMELFAVDLRAMAAVRIGAGILLLADLANRWPDLAAHYTDDGVLPRADRWNLLVDFGLSGWTSLHMLSGATWFQGMIFLLTAIAATCLALGYRTRAATIACFALLFSLHARNPLVLQCGDTLFRCLLFWCMILPMGAAWSVDARRHRRRTVSCNPEPSAKVSRGHLPVADGSGLNENQNGVQPTRIVSAATVALLLQLCYVYVFTALLKTDASWRIDFSAVHYALHHDHFTSAWGYRLLEYPALLPALTLAAWLWEWAGPFLLFIPLATSRIRVFVVAAFIGFHLGLAATMELGLFPYYCICYWLVFLPSGVWDNVDSAGSALLRAFRDRLVRLTRSQRRRVASNQELRRRWLRVKRLQRERSRHRLQPDGRAPFQPGATIAIHKWRDRTVWFLLAYVTLLNIRRLDGDWFATIGRGPLRHVARATGLDQCWCMFATGPHDFGGWLVMRGVLADGREVNLWSPDEPLPTIQPTLVSGMYPSHRWRRYVLYLHELPDEVQRRAMARYLRNHWDRSHPGGSPVVGVELINMVRPTPPLGQTVAPCPAVRPVLLYQGM